jgi:hypothetical protein
LFPLQNFSHSLKLVFEIRKDLGGYTQKLLKMFLTITL